MKFQPASCLLLNRFATVNGQGRVIREELPTNARKAGEAVTEASRNDLKPREADYPTT